MAADGLVVDELLCYVSSWIGVEAADLLIRDCVLVFTEDEIWTAKKRFFELSGGTARCVARRNGVRPKSELDMEDLYREFLSATSEGRPLPTFVAKDGKRLAKISRGGGGVASCSCLNSGESQASGVGLLVSRLDELVAKVAAIEVSSSKCEKKLDDMERNRRAEESTQVSTRAAKKLKWKAAGSDLTVPKEVLTGSQTKPGSKGKTFSEVVVEGVDKGRGQSASADGVEEMGVDNPGVVSAEPVVPGNSEAESRNVLGDTGNVGTRKNLGESPKDGFTVVGEKRKRRSATKVVVGTRPKIGGIGSVPRGPKRAFLFVGRCDPATTAEEINLFLQGEGVEVLSCSQLGSQHARFVSFRVAIGYQHREKVLEPALWTEGVEVRPFYLNGLGQRTLSKYLSEIGPDGDKGLAQMKNLPAGASVPITPQSQNGQGHD